MKTLCIALILTLFFSVSIPGVNSFADQHTLVKISEANSEGELPAENKKWTDNERSERVSHYGAIAPLQVPINYTGRAMDAVVSGIGRATSFIISLPFKAMPRKSNPNTGGQNAEEKTKKEN